MTLAFGHLRQVQGHPGDLVQTHHRSGTQSARGSSPGGSRAAPLTPAHPRRTVTARNQRGPDKQRRDADTNWERPALGEVVLGVEYRALANATSDCLGALDPAPAWNPPRRRRSGEARTCLHPTSTPAAPWPPPTIRNAPVSGSRLAAAEIVDGYQALWGDLMRLLHELEADVRRVSDDRATS